MSADADEPLRVEDNPMLTDADWAVFNKLRDVFRDGGQCALSKAIGALAEADPIQYLHIMDAFFPDMVREIIQDSMAEMAMTEQDLRELIRKSESPTRDQ